MKSLTLITAEQLAGRFNVAVSIDSTWVRLRRIRKAAWLWPGFGRPLVPQSIETVLFEELHYEKENENHNTDN